MRHELAQVNIARLVAPLDDPRLLDFVDALDPVNADADTAAGFIWRLQTGSSAGSVGRFMRLDGRVGVGSTGRG